MCVFRAVCYFVKCLKWFYIHILPKMPLIHPHIMVYIYILYIHVAIDLLCSQFLFNLLKTCPFLSRLHSLSPPCSFSNHSHSLPLVSSLPPSPPCSGSWVDQCVLEGRGYPALSGHHSRVVDWEAGMGILRSQDPPGTGSIPVVGQYGTRTASSVIIPYIHNCIIHFH